MQSLKDQDEILEKLWVAQGRHVKWELTKIEAAGEEYDFEKMEDHGVGSSSSSR